MAGAREIFSLKSENAVTC